jgi:hypothetical protein
MDFIKKAAVVAAVATAFAGLVGQGSAFACATPSCLPEPVASDAGVVVGTGTIAPGLTTVPTTQTSVTFDSSLLVIAGDEGVNVTGRVHFDGASDGPETLNAGQGHGTLTGDLGGTVSYSRTANIVTLEGSINAGNDPDGDAIRVGACIFAPTKVNPVDSYALICAVVTQPSPDHQ